MTECIQGIFEQYSLYTGTGIFMGLFFVALIYLAISEKNANVRSIILYGSSVMIAFIFVPLTYYVYVRLVDETSYWRMWWMIPVSITLAYVGAKLIDKNRITGILLCFFIFALGGRMVYSDDDLSFMENAYQLPSYVVDVCDVIIEDSEGKRVTAAMPDEFLEWTRQYTVDIRMPYGREQYVRDDKNDFYMVINRDIADFDVLALYCRAYKTDYIVMPDSVKYSNAPEECGFTMLAKTDGYYVFRYDEN